MRRYTDENCTVKHGFWDEMNRRERWDREYEKHKPWAEDDIAELKQARDEEEMRRLEWDKDAGGSGIEAACEMSA